MQTDQGFRNRLVGKYNFSVFKTECLFSFGKKFFLGYKCVMIDGNLQFVVQRTKPLLGFATGVPWHELGNSFRSFVLGSVCSLLK